MTRDAALPLLDGLRVLEFGHIAAAPFCGMLLADLGADVVKIEAPDGDGLRAWPPIATSEGGNAFSLNFASLNRGKRSVVANLKDGAALERVLALCGCADVILENYRPGTLHRLGLGFAAVAARNPSIVYCSISGYGQTGERARNGAFDVVVQGASGLMSVTGEPDGPPVKCGVPVGDFTAGLYAAYTIVAAHARAVREKRPVHLDCAMLDCLLGISALQTSEYWGTGIAPARLGSAHPRNAPYQAFDASDAPFIVAAGNDHLWREVCEATGRLDLLDDPRFAGIAQRAKNQAELAAMLQQVFATRTAREWLAEFERRGVPSGPLNSFADVLGDPALVESDLIQSMDVPVAGATRTIAYPVQMNGRRARATRPPPVLGEHTQDVFAEWTSSARHPAADER